MNSAKSGNTGGPSKAKSRTLPYKCDLCPKRFSDKRGLECHSYCHTDETPYQCTMCSYAGKTKKYLNRHIKVSHVRERKFECKECGKSFHYGSKLKSHMLIHTGEKPYKCSECDKAFNSSYSLNTHRLIHSNLKPFKCTFCAYACRDSSTLRKHKERHTGEIKYYTCGVCNTSCATRATLKIHIAEKHFGIDVKKMECDYCSKRFKFRETLINHIQAVHERSRTAKCEICGKTLSNRGNMRSHMRTHVDDRPFKCTYQGCRKRYKDTSSLGKHVIIHYPERQFPCKICDRLFVREYRMQAHLKTHMVKVKKEECGYCGVRFYNKNYLTTHIQRKHGRKKQKYVCDLCGLVTTNKPSIVMHIKYGHGGDKEQTKECDICNKTFKRDLNLKLHYWMVHEMEYNIPEKYKKKSKKTDEEAIKVKEEPIDGDYESGPLFTVTPKIEPLDEEGLEALTSMVPEPEIRSEFGDIPNDMFEQFITSVAKGRQDRRLKHAHEGYVDKKMEKRVKKRINGLMEEKRKKEREREMEIRKRNEERELKLANRALERTRRKYNKLIRNALKNSLKKDKVKIKHGAISAQEQPSDSLLEANFFIKQTIDNRDCIIDGVTNEEKEIGNNDLLAEERDNDTGINIEENEIENNETGDDIPNEVDNIEEYKSANENENSEEGRKYAKRQCVRNRKYNIEENYIDHNENGNDVQNEIDNIEEYESDSDENRKSVEGRRDAKINCGRNRKLKFNTHQCYVCFKVRIEYLVCIEA